MSRRIGNAPSKADRQKQPCEHIAESAKNYSRAIPENRAMNGNNAPRIRAPRTPHRFLNGYRSRIVTRHDIYLDWKQISKKKRLFTPVQKQKLHTNNRSTCFTTYFSRFVGSASVGVAPIRLPSSLHKASSYSTLSNCADADHISSQAWTHIVT